jgi:formiminotetrahydrofolate cyclodeaminase
VGEETIAHFLDELASGAPVPGGGAAAALEAALGAALVSMVCNLTIGKEKYRAYEQTMMEARAAAEELRAQALALAAEDSASYSAVGAAYALPRGSDEEKVARQARIQEALKGATEVPLRTGALAVRVIELCAHIVDGANTNAISDVGVGALSARAALDGAALNVKTNLALIKDEEFKVATATRTEGYLNAAHPLVDKVTHTVEASIGR